MGDPLFTVVIPAYNREKTISKAIESVKKQTYKQWKLLIIDDHSTDQTVARIQAYQAQDSRIGLLTLQQNVGISKLMNRALAQIDTPYFIQLDSDDWLAPQTLKAFARAIKRADPQTALFYANVRMVQRGTRKWQVVRQIRHRFFKDKYDFLQYLTYMLHPRCYRTAAVRQVGGWEINDAFDGRLMEDRRICLKLIENYPHYWVDRYLYYRRKHPQQLTQPSAYHKRNLLRYQLIEESLKKWGNHYQAHYGYRGGLLVIKKLEKKK